MRKLSVRDLANVVRYGDLTDTDIGTDSVADLSDISKTTAVGESTEIKMSDDGDVYVLVTDRQGDVLDGYELAAS